MSAAGEAVSKGGDTARRGHPTSVRPRGGRRFSAPQVQPGLDVALANGWLELWYQPKIDLRTGALAGAEGLVRYCHPVHGVHPIDSLLPQASAETRAALIQHFLIRALHDWEELDRAGINVRTAVNANVDVLTNVDLTGLVRQNRPRGATWPGLILEISEHEVIRDLNLAHEIATQLRIYDITLAISNFGAGFSSFERLRELPFSELKLHPDSSRVVRTTQEMPASAGRPSSWRIASRS